MERGRVVVVVVVVVMAAAAMVCGVCVVCGVWMSLAWRRVGLGGRRRAAAYPEALRLAFWLRGTFRLMRFEDVAIVPATGGR